MKFNIENCDVIMGKGFLRLIYHTDKMAVPLVLAACKSYHDLNEKAMKILGKNEWAEDVVEWSIRDESPVWHNLLADIYKNHHDLYESVISDEDKNEDDSECYLTLTVTGAVDEETGHRLARFNEADLNEMDTDDLMSLAKDLGLYTPYMMRHEVIEVLANEDIDIDDCGHDEICDSCNGCDCAEKMPAGNVVCHCNEDEYDEGEEECPFEHDYDDCNYGEKVTDGEYICSYEEDKNASDSFKPTETQPYEYVNGPAHYNGTECIENMRKLYGDDAVRWFCILSAYKYRFRDGSKPGVSAGQDHEKAHWYEDYAVKMMGEQRYY